MSDGEKKNHDCLHRHCNLFVNLHGSATLVLKFFDKEPLPLPGVDVVLLSDML